jgi:hypothetical protein
MATFGNISTIAGGTMAATATQDARGDKTHTMTISVAGSGACFVAGSRVWPGGPRELVLPAAVSCPCSSARLTVSAFLHLPPAAGLESGSAAGGWLA